MRICVTGTISMGKSTYVNDFCKAWPMYKNADVSYRKILKDMNLPHSTQGTAETQTIIRDSLIKDIQSYKRDDHVIFDRGLLDNMAYTLYLNEKGVINDDYVRDTVPIIREALSYYDIIFFTPMLDNYPVELDTDTKNGARDVNPEFRIETDSILKELERLYHNPKEKGAFFPNTDCPAIISLFGKPQERIEMTKLYINPKGNPYGEEDSLIVNPFEKASDKHMYDINSASDIPVDASQPTYE